VNRISIIVLVILTAIAGYLFYKSRTGGTGTGGTGTGGTGTGGTGTGGTGTGGGVVISRKVTIEKTTIVKNEYLTFTISGFSAGEEVKIYVWETGGYFLTQLDSNGGGTYAFRCGDPSGNYTLVISGQSGTAQAAFTVI